jgi:urease accessory protein
MSGVPAAPGPKISAASAADDWLIWQLADSAFPTGGFAHSSGLEAAWQHGEIAGRAELIWFVEASLDQLGHGSFPLVLAAFDEPGRADELDQLCHAFTNNHVANRASRFQGRAFLTAAIRIFKLTDEKPWRHAHFAPVFGACLRRLGLSRQAVARMFFYNHLRGVLAAAVRLNIVGPMEAQALTRQMYARAEAILDECQRLTVDDLAQTAPVLDVWQGAHDRLYSRLFQS